MVQRSLNSLVICNLVETMGRKNLRLSRVVVLIVPRESRWVLKIVSDKVVEIC